MAIISPYDELDSYTWDTVPSDAWSSFFLDRWFHGGQILEITTNVTASGGFLLSGQSGISSTSFASATGACLLNASTILSTTSDLVATAELVNPTANLFVTSTVSADARILRNANAQMAASGFLLAAVDAQLSDSALVIRVPSETRRFRLSSENRTYRIGIFSE